MLETHFHTRMYHSSDLWKLEYSCKDLLSELTLAATVVTHFLNLYCSYSFFGFEPVIWLEGACYHNYEVVSLSPSYLSKKKRMNDVVLANQMLLLSIALESMIQEVYVGNCEARFVVTVIPGYCEELIMLGKDLRSTNCWPIMSQFIVSINMKPGFVDFVLKSKPLVPLRK